MPQSSLVLVRNPSRPVVTVPREVARSLRVSVLGTFELTEGPAAVGLPVGAQHLLAFLALHERAVARVAIAGTLWPDVSEAHANASLRSALWRLDTAVRGTIEVNALDLRLAPTVTVDIRDARALAHRLLLAGSPLEPVDLSAASIAALSTELLPDWYDDWALIEVEAWRDLRLHALEVLSGLLVVERRFGDAAAAALAALASSPLRESAYAALIRVHLAEGNRSAALAAFERCRAVLHAEMGLDPAPRLCALVEHLHRM